MEAERIASLGPQLGRYLARFEDCLARSEHRQHLRRYVNGQLSELPRKSIEPMALACGIPPRNLQQFFSLHHWDHDLMRDRLQQMVGREHPHPHSIGVFDETAHPKKGDMTPGVQRQWCGNKGTTDNCTLTVHLSYAAGDFHCLLDSELYLPKSWSDDRERCRGSGIPDSMVYRPKVEIALELLDRSRRNGVRLEWVTFDEAYGMNPEFLHALDDRGQRYVGEVAPSSTGWIKRPAVLQREHYTFRPITPAGAVIGRPRTFPRVKVQANGCHKAKSVENLARHSKTYVKQKWRRYYVKDANTGPVIWDVKHAPFYIKRDGVPTFEHWLIVARSPFTGEVKYFVSNAPPGTPLEAILTVAFGRWSVERCFEDTKSQLGLSHFEVRTYKSLIRHLILTAVTYLFLAEVNQRWRAERGERQAPDHLPGPDRGRGRGPIQLGERSGAPATSRADRRSNQLPPAQHRPSQRLAPQSDEADAPAKGHPPRSITLLSPADYVAL